MDIKRIRDLREDSDYTQEYIAHLLNISQRTYSRYENGEHSIPLYVLCYLANFYGTSVDYLLNQTNVRTPYPPARNVFQNTTKKEPNKRCQKKIPKMI